MSAVRERRPRRRSAWVGWAVGPLMFAAALVVALALAKEPPAGLFGAVLAVLFTVPLVWIAASALWPASADRKCPSCGSNALERLDPQSTVGLRCGACGWEDADESAWLLAEEEGPLERIVLEQKRRRRTSRSAVDSPGKRD